MQINKNYYFLPFILKVLLVTQIIISAIIFSGCSEDVQPQKMISSDANTNEKFSQLHKGKQERPRSDSPEPISVRINSYVFKIPAWYIAQNSENNKFAPVFALWPGLTPVAKEITGGSEGQKSPNKAYDLIEILISGRDSASQLPDERLAESRIRTSPGLQEPVYNEELKLWDYRRKIDSDKPHYFIAKNFYTAFYENAPLFINCYVKPHSRSNDGIRCGVSYFRNEDIRITYRFYYKHIKDWSLIDREVRALINSFYSGE